MPANSDARTGAVCLLSLRRDNGWGIPTSAERLSSELLGSCCIAEQ